jgi:hypothetical protein
MKYNLEKTILKIEFIDGKKQQFEFDNRKDENNYMVKDYGIQIKLKQLFVEGFTPCYQEEFFFPYSNIKCIRYIYHYLES